MCAFSWAKRAKRLETRYLVSYFSDGLLPASIVARISQTVEPFDFHLPALEGLESTGAAPGDVGFGAKEPFDGFPDSFADGRDDDTEVQHATEKRRHASPFRDRATRVVAGRRSVISRKSTCFLNESTLKT